MEEPIIIDIQLYSDKEYEPLKKTVEDDTFIKGGQKMISENYYGNYNQEKERKVTIEALEAMETLQKYCKTHHRCAICPFSIKGECFLRQGYEPADWTVGQLVN